MPLKSIYQTIDQSISLKFSTDATCKNFEYFFSILDMGVQSITYTQWRNSF